MRIIDCFAGIGGFSLAADALGWETVAFVEWDASCQHWLAHHWPDVPIYSDVTTVDWTIAPPCDVFTAGFPCQPHSLAGKRQASDDSRDLWSECVRAISTLRPRYAVLENVPGLLTSESGRFFNRVLSDLAKIGYVGRYDVLSAAKCGAPHRRERVWIVAYPANANEQSGQRGASGERGNTLQHRGCCSGVGEGRAGSGEPVRQALGGRDGVGNATNERCEGLRAGRQQELRSYAGSGLPVRRGSQLRHPWADATPYRGADGTVRLIPAGAVADDKSAGREASRAERRRDDNGSCGNGGLAAGTDGAVRREEEISRPEPALRALVDGIPDNVARRHAAEEAAQGEVTLWPVTDSEPGRVARLKAVGNAVVPAWVLAGPFQYILDREGLRDNAPAV